MRGPVSASAKTRLSGLALVIAAAAGSGCAGPPGPVEACLTITPSEKLHTYNGQPHVLPIYVYSLASTLAFERLEVPALLAGDQKIEGVVGGPLELIIYPGQVVKFHEVLDPKTTQLGIVADYHRGPNDPPGTRKVVVPADCGMFGDPKVRLTPTDILVE
jgi:type VI secretion system VasD/TssJ family lipoprotein